MTDLSSLEKRTNLAPRGAPYFHKISPGRHLGFRKLVEGGTWIAREQPSSGQRKHRKIGPEADFDFHEALAEAIEWFQREGDDVEVPESRLSLRLVCSQYLTYRHDETEFEGFTSTRSLFNCYVFPSSIADKLVTNLKTADYQAWLKRTGDKIHKKHKDPDPKERKRKAFYTANMTWHWIESALNRAAKINKKLPTEEWKAVEPLKGGKSKSRPVFLDEGQCQRLVNAMGPGPLQDLTSGGIFTGARLGELKAMRVQDLDLRGGIWTPSHSKTEKGHADRFLEAQAVELLKRLTVGKAPEDLVFTPDGESWRSRHWRPFNEAVKRAKLPKGTCFYSLRHSYISKLVAAGVQPLFIAENCGTSVKEIEKTYAKFKPDQKRKLLAQGAIKLDLPESNVVGYRVRAT